MPKKQEYYLCTECGAVFSKWSGRCAECLCWNTIIESSGPLSPSSEKAGSVALSSVALSENERASSGIKEFDLVCGGGLVRGSVILLGGEPGIGKSTMALQVASCFNTLYISGEESASQIRQRAGRISIPVEKIRISVNTEAEAVITLAEFEKPELLVVDSIQTLRSSTAPGSPGSISQIRETASILSRFSKKNGITVLLIGHITKDGAIAGPKALEHLVDTVLYFEGDSCRDFRMLRSFKNRYGSVNELGIFRMSSAGLAEVREKNSVFMNAFSSEAPGSAVSVSSEGSRAIIFEVQALVTFSPFPNPRRMSDGLDINRLVIIIAVLERYTGLKINSFDVFINVSGGYRINEPAADLAVAVSIASSVKSSPVSRHTAFIGEISLSGEIRSVNGLGKKLDELIVSGFKRIFVPSGSKIEGGKNFAGEIIQVASISEALDLVFTA